MRELQGSQGAIRQIVSMRWLHTFLSPSGYETARNGRIEGLAVEQRNQTEGAEFGDLSIDWIEAFVRSARAEKRTAAAAEMGIDQSTVTRHIQSLEKWLGRGNCLPLVEEKRGVKLSAAGADFLDTAELVLELLRNARVPLSQPDRPETPTVALEAEKPDL